MMHDQTSRTKQRKLTRTKQRNYKQKQIITKENTNGVEKINNSTVHGKKVNAQSNTTQAAVEERVYNFNE